MAKGKCRLFSQAAIPKDAANVPVLPFRFLRLSIARPVTQASAWRTSQNDASGEGFYLLEQKSIFLFYTSLRSRRLEIMGVRENAALPSNWIGGGRRFSWASRAGAPSPPACLPRAPRSFLRPSYPSVCYTLLATCRLHSQTNLSCTCVSPSSALSVTISLLEAPTSPACICLGARKTDRRLSSECHEHFS